MDAFFANKPLLIKLLYLVVFTLGCGIICSSIGQVAAQYLSSSTKNQLFILQFFSQIGYFILPALLYFRIFKLKLECQNQALMNIGVWILFFICIIPISSGLYAINQSLHFPEMFANLEAQLRMSELQIETSSLGFLTGNSVGDLALNLLIVAIVPAIAEELFFRGCLQKTLQNATQAWVAILLSSIIFSAVHFQFFSFLPRFLFGIILGYSYYKSQNILIPILLHFINNALVVVWTYLFQNQYISISPNYLEQNLGVFVYLILGFLIGALFYFIKCKSPKRASLIKNSTPK